MDTEDQYEWILENPDKKPTKYLSAEELKALYDAMYNSNGLVIVDIKSNNGWCKCNLEHAPMVDHVYRVKRKIVETPLDIPWGLIDDVYNYAAMYKSGAVYFYESEPFVKESREDWWPDGDDFTKSFLKHNINGINWKHSLARRCQTK